MHHTSHQQLGSFSIPSPADPVGASGISCLFDLLISLTAAPAPFLINLASSASNSSPLRVKRYQWLDNYPATTSRKCQPRRSGPNTIILRAFIMLPASHDESSLASLLLFLSSVCSLESLSKPSVFRILFRGFPTRF